MLDPPCYSPFGANGNLEPSLTDDSTESQRESFLLLGAILSLLVDQRAMSFQSSLASKFSPNISSGFCAIYIFLGLLFFLHLFLFCFLFVSSLFCYCCDWELNQPPPI